MWILFKQQEEDLLLPHVCTLYYCACKTLPSSLIPFLDTVEGDLETETGTGNPNNLQNEEIASVFLPPELFDLLEDVDEVGLIFAVYENAALFPLPEGSSENDTIGSPVLGASVAGRTFVALEEPVIILLHLFDAVRNILHNYNI